MFCPNCGIKVADGTVYCGNCGFNIAESEGAGETALLTDPPASFVRNQQYVDISRNQSVNQQPYQNAPAPSQTAPVSSEETQKPEKEKKPKEKKKKKTGLIIGLVLAALAVVIVLVGVVGLVVGSFFISPKATAEDFASKLEAEDIQRVYKMLFPEGSYVTYEQFVQKYEGEADFLVAYTGHDGYEIIEKSDVDGVKTYEIVYSPELVLNVAVVKTNDGFLYFDDYRVEILHCVKYDIYIPEGAKAYINNVQITGTADYDPATALYHYTVSPLLSGNYKLKVMDAEGNTYEKLIQVFGDDIYNSISIDAEDIKRGNIIKDTYTTDDAEEFFYYIMDEYTFNSYRAFYFGTPESLITYGVESLMLNDYRLHAGYEYNSSLECVTDNAKEGIYISDIMSQEEYASLPDKSEGYAVYKVSEVQKRIDNLWGVGAITVNTFMGENDFITSKGYLIRDNENAEKGIYDYYGKIKSSEFDANANQVVIEAYILRCDTENKKVYDEGTGLQVASAQITRGTGVDFDAIVEELGINTKKLATIRFAFQLSDYGVTLLGALENAVSQDVLNAQNVSMVNYPKTFYIKVKADGGLNMRYEPTAQSEVIKLIPDKVAIEVIGYDPNIKDWVYAAWDGYEGWVNYAYLTPAVYSSQPNGQVYWYRVDADGGLNMRNKDDIKGSVVKLIPDTALIELHCFNQDATWAYVTYSKYRGWVNTDFIYIEY